MKKAVWITWEHHRRSNELAKAFDAELVTIEYKQSSIWRYPLSILKTISTIATKRPDTLFAQNPSLILAALTTALKPIFRYKLIIDRHSNFRFLTMDSKLLKWRFFHFLSKYTVKNADITIVTVDSLKKLVNEWGGCGVVLQDKIPHITTEKGNNKKLDGNFNIVCVSTFVADEPIFEIVKAARAIDNNIHIYMTGKYQNFPQIEELQKIKPANVTFTGFISEHDYVQLLNSADGIMVLTILDELLTCGAYEAVALKKPMILSNTEALSSYFFKGAVYANPDSKSIADAITKLKDNHESYIKDVFDLHIELDKNWIKTFDATGIKKN